MSITDRKRQTGGGSVRRSVAALVAIDGATVIGPCVTRGGTSTTVRERVKCGDRGEEIKHPRRVWVASPAEAEYRARMLRLETAAYVAKARAGERITGSVIA